MRYGVTLPLVDPKAATFVSRRSRSRARDGFRGSRSAIDKAKLLAIAQKNAVKLLNSNDLKGSVSFSLSFLDEFDIFYPTLKWSLSLFYFGLSLFFAGLSLSLSFSISRLPSA